MSDVCWQFVVSCFGGVESAYLNSWYWAHAPVLHLNISHSVKAGAHLKQKGQMLEEVDLKVKSGNNLSKKREIKDPKKISQLVRDIFGTKWYISCTRRMSRVARLPAATGLHFIFFQTIYRTNEEGYDQFDHIWGDPAIVPYNNIPDKISPTLLSSRTLYLMRACAGRPIRWSGMTQRLPTLPRPAESAQLLQSLQYSPYFACCALFS